ncbi:acyltransferase [Nocardioides zeae]
MEIGNGAWIGARALILPGVSVSEGCVIAAGAVVNRNTEPHGLYAGVPARRIRDL